MIGLQPLKRSTPMFAREQVSFGFRAMLFMDAWKRGPYTLLHLSRQCGASLILTAMLTSFLDLRIHSVQCCSRSQKRHVTLCRRCTLLHAPGLANKSPQGSIERLSMHPACLWSLLHSQCDSQTSDIASIGTPCRVLRPSAQVRHI